MMGITKSMIDRRNYLSVDRNLILILGSDKAVLLTELARKESILVARKRIREDMYFYYKKSELMTNLGVKRTTLTSNIKFLKDYGIIDIKRQIGTSLNLYKLNEDLIYELLTIQIPSEIKAAGTTRIRSWVEGGPQPESGRYIRRSKCDLINLSKSEGLSKDSPIEKPEGFRQKDISNKIDIPNQKEINLAKFNKFKKDKYYPILMLILNKSNKYFKHTLPNEKNDFKITKILKESLQILNDIANNKFLDKIDISNYPEDFLNLGVINHPLFEKEFKEIIEITLDRWELMFKQNYFPYDKEWMFKISLPNWFYNRRTNKSNFLSLLDLPLPIKEENEISLKNEIDENILAGYLSLFEEVDETKLDVLYQNIKEVISFGKEYTEKYGEYLKYTNHYKHSFGSEYLICSKHIEYLKTYQDIQIGHIKFDGKVWMNFQKKIYKDFEIDLCPTEKTIEKWKSRYYLNESRNITDKIKKYYDRNEEPPKELVEKREKYMELFNKN